MTKAKSILIESARKERRKAFQKRSEADKHDANANEIEAQADKLN